MTFCESLSNEISSNEKEGKWLWQSGKLKSGMAIPWEVQLTSMKNCLWEENKTFLLIEKGGMYRLEILIFDINDVLESNVSNISLQILLDGDIKCNLYSPKDNQKDSVKTLTLRTTGREEKLSLQFNSTVIYSFHSELLNIKDKSKLAICFTKEENTLNIRAIISLKSIFV